MGSSHQEEKKEPESAADALGVQPRPWQRARPVARIKPQYNASDVAKRFLDDMETGGRLHHQLKRDA